MTAGRNDACPMHLCVTGLRSVGKTTVARRLAAQLRRPHYDTDELVKEALAEAGTSFESAMSAERYELIYRAMEPLLRETLGTDTKIVLSAASGCLFDPALRDLLRASSLLVGLLPDRSPARTARLLLERERERKHFAHLSADKLLRWVERDAHEAMGVMNGSCHGLIVVGRASVDAIVAALEDWFDGAIRNGSPEACVDLTE